MTQLMTHPSFLEAHGVGVSVVPKVLEDKDL